MANEIAAVLIINNTEYKITTDWTLSYSEIAVSFGGTNPATGNPWTIDEVNGIGTYGIQSFGYASGPDVGGGIFVYVSRVYLEVNYTEGKRSRSFII